MSPLIPVAPNVGIPSVQIGASRECLFAYKVFAACEGRVRRISVVGVCSISMKQL